MEEDSDVVVACSGRLVVEDVVTCSETLLVADVVVVVVACSERLVVVDDVLAGGRALLLFQRLDW